MGFETLLGNRQLKENLTASLKNNHISHFYLLSGPEGSGKHTERKEGSTDINKRICRRKNFLFCTCKSGKTKKKGTPQQRI